MADNNPTTPVPPPAAAAAGADGAAAKKSNPEKDEAKRLKMEKFLAKQKVLPVHPDFAYWWQGWQGWQG